MVTGTMKILLDFFRHNIFSATSFLKIIVRRTRLAGKILMCDESASGGEHPAL